MNARNSKCFLKYRKTKECIERSLNVLSGDVEVEWTETRADLSHNKHRAEELLIFHLSCLSQVATDTNNLILVSGALCTGKSRTI